MVKAVLARLFHDRRGVAAIEFGFVAPVLFSMLLGGLEFGRMFYVRQGLEGVVETAARYYVSNPTKTSSDITSYMQSQPMMGGSIGLVSFAYTDTTSCNGNSKVTCTLITGTYAFTFVAAYLGFSGRSLTATAQAVRLVSQ